MSNFNRLNTLAVVASRTLENGKKWGIRNRSSSFDSNSPASSAKTVSPLEYDAVSYTHLTLPTNREV